MWPEVLLHAIPISHSAESDPYLVMGLLTLGVIAALLAGLAIGTRVMQAAAPTRTAAAALWTGTILFLLYDLLKQTASLGQGLTSRPLYQAVLLLSFVAAAAFLPAFSKGSTTGHRVMWAWAIGIGLHGAGEAWIVGTEALTADITAPFPAASFLLHKIMEGASIPIIAGLATKHRARLHVAGGLGLMALAAGAAGYLLGPGRAPIVFFALGAGATASALVLLAKRVPWDTRHALFLGAGVALIYVAGLLHELG